MVRCKGETENGAQRDGRKNEDVITSEAAHESAFDFLRIKHPLPTGPVAPAPAAVWCKDAVIDTHINDDIGATWLMQAVNRCEPHSQIAAPLLLLAILFSATSTLCHHFWVKTDSQMSPVSFVFHPLFPRLSCC